MPDFPIRGYEYYDFHHELVNDTFVNYEPNALRDAGAISYLLFTSFGMSTDNWTKGLTFENAQPVIFPQIQRLWVKLVVGPGGSGGTFDPAAPGARPPGGPPRCGPPGCPGAPAGPCRGTCVDVSR